MESQEPRNQSVKIIVPFSARHPKLDEWLNEFMAICSFICWLECLIDLIFMLIKGVVLPDWSIYLVVPIMAIAPLYILLWVIYRHLDYLVFKIQVYKAKKKGIKIDQN